VLRKRPNILTVLDACYIDLDNRCLLYSAVYTALGLSKTVPFLTRIFSATRATGNSKLAATYKLDSVFLRIFDAKSTSAVPLATLMELQCQVPGWKWLGAIIKPYVYSRQNKIDDKSLRHRVSRYITELEVRLIYHEDMTKNRRHSHCLIKSKERVSNKHCFMVFCCGF
jgi:hypothetical protein